MREVEHGWIEGRPSAEALAWARAQFARDCEDARPVKASYFDVSDAVAGVGALAERALAVWLRGRGVGYTHIGGVNARPDFTVAGVEVACKCQVVHVDFRPRHWVVVPHQHIDSVGEQLFFCAYRPEHERMLLLGGIARSDFKNTARFRDVGEEIGPRTVARNPVWQLPAGQLMSPAAWLAHLRNGDPHVLRG